MLRDNIAEDKFNLCESSSIDYDQDAFEYILKEMINCGLTVIEVYHSSHTKEEMEYYLGVADKYNLLVRWK